MIPELKLWSVDGSSAAESVPQLSQVPAEREFENVLVSNPEMLEPGLKLVGTADAGRRRMAGPPRG